jgi:amidase/aspartyl-tRNA(Asn)/glutamyl-tRNA(Gln) amidotransferase subunit A
MSGDHLARANAATIVTAMRAGAITAVAVTEAALARIEQCNPSLNCFTTITAERALATARAVDARRVAGVELGPLAGVPFAVKNLFDLQGIVTIAGSVIDAEHPPAVADATVVARLVSAGAVPVGALNMDEYAYGFTTENSHYGPVHNPYDLSRVAGGSSGGSAAAVAAGLVPLSLGSDTNGSIRVPASLCGIFGLKPTHGRLSRAGARLFATSLDHVGAFARTVADLAAAYDAMQGSDPRDPVCAECPAEPAAGELRLGASGLRIAVLDGHFAGTGPAAAAVSTIASALSESRRVEIPEATRARAAAFVITAAEGGNLHLADLKTRAADFDPMTRDRFLAGALVPAAWVIEAQRFRNWYREQVPALFRDSDILLAPRRRALRP